MTAGFITELLMASATPDITRSSFIQAVARGECPVPILASYAAEMAALAKGFPDRLAAILGNCDHPDARRAILSNILEEEGVVSYRSESGLILDPDKRHSAMATRFAMAAGTSRPEPAARSSQWVNEKLAGGRWLGPFAYVSVGFEANIPRTFRLLVDGLRAHYGFTASELEFFIEHLTADEKHGSDGAAIAASAATTAELREEALTGARRGALAWWHFHENHARRLRSLRAVFTSA